MLVPHAASPPAARRPTPAFLAEADAAAAHSAAGRYEDAVAGYRRALRLQSRGPNASVLWADVGSNLARLGRRDEAEVAYGRALRVGAPSFGVHHNLGLFYYQAGRPEAAVRHLREALRLINERGGLGLAGMEADERGRLRPFRSAVASDLSLALLKSGDLHAGLVAAECRWDLMDPSPVWRTGLPHWEGEPLDGRTIIVHHEQGLGDSIQFVRFVLQLVVRGARVVLATSTALRSLFAHNRERLGVAEVVDVGSPAEVAVAAARADYHCPMLSVVRVLGLGYDDVPLRSLRPPYLWAPEEVSVERSPGTRLAVGVVWAASLGYGASRQRSVAIEELVGLADVSGVRLYGLQVGPFRRDLLEHQDKVGDLAGTIASLADTASIMADLDLIISVDSAPAHVAGALGLPVWVFNPLVPCWRWCRGAGLWYPTMRLWDQRTPGTWREVIEDMKKELVTMVGARGLVAA